MRGHGIIDCPDLGFVADVYDFSWTDCADSPAEEYDFGRLLKDLCHADGCAKSLAHRSSLSLPLVPSFVLYLPQRVDFPLKCLPTLAQLNYVLRADSFLFILPKEERFPTLFPLECAVR